MKKKFIVAIILLIVVVISFLSGRKHQLLRTVDDEMVNLAVDAIIEQQERVEAELFVREYLKDSTIQIVDIEKGILCKDSICFFYDMKWNYYLVIPDSFRLEIADDHLSMSLISERAEIKTWVAPRDEEIWRGNEAMGSSLINAGVTIDELIQTDSIFVLSGDAKKGDISYYSYLKIISLPEDSTDLYISYQTPSKYKQGIIIKNVIKQFPNKPF